MHHIPLGQRSWIRNEPIGWNLHKHACTHTHSCVRTEKWHAPHCLEPHRAKVPSITHRHTFASHLRMFSICFILALFLHCTLGENQNNGRLRGGITMRPNLMSFFDDGAIFNQSNASVPDSAPETIDCSMRSGQKSLAFFQAVDGIIWWMRREDSLQTERSTRCVVPQLMETTSFPTTWLLASWMTISYVHFNAVMEPDELFTSL